MVQILPIDEIKQALAEKLREELVSARAFRYPVLLFDDFEAGNFSWGLHSTYGYVRRSVDVAMRGEACMELGTPATANYEAIAHKHFGSFAGKASLEFWFMSSRKSTPLYGEQPDFSSFKAYLIDFLPDDVDGASLILGAFRYTPPDKKFSILTYNDVWFDVYTSARGLYAPFEAWISSDTYKRWAVEAFQTWHFVKLVIDTTTKKYVSLQVDNLKFDLSAYTLNWRSSSVYSEAANGIVRFFVTTPEADVKRVWIDDVLVEVLE